MSKKIPPNVFECNKLSLHQQIRNTFTFFLHEQISCNLNKIIQTEELTKENKTNVLLGIYNTILLYTKEKAF